MIYRPSDRQHHFAIFKTLQQYFIPHTMIVRIEMIEDKKKPLELVIKSKDNRPTQTYLFENDEVCRSISYVLQDHNAFRDPENKLFAFKYRN